MADVCDRHETIKILIKCVIQKSLEPQYYHLDKFIAAQFTSFVLFHDI